MTTGQRMKSRRKEIGLSAEKVAEMLGVSPATVYRYEKGDIEKVPGDLLDPIAKALQTTPGYLMGWEENGQQKSLVNDDEELTEYLEMLRTRPECRMFFSLAKGATKEDVEKAVAIVEALRKAEGRM